MIRPHVNLIGTAGLLLFLVLPLPAQQAKSARTNPGSPCGDKSRGLPDYYYDAVLKRIHPPGWRKSLVRIEVGEEQKLALWTDGDTFRLWTDSPQVPQHNIGAFLDYLDQSCRLPADPADAADLITVKWESRELSRAQFAQIHRNFTAALTEYVASIQGRYSTIIAARMQVLHLDAEGYSIVYDNSYEHIQLVVWNFNEEPGNPTLNWVHELQKLAEESFHRHFGP